MGMRRISFESWCKLFKPISNPFEKAPACSGYLFDDFGDAASFVKLQNELHIWSLTVTDETRTTAWIISNGFTTVNRFGYFVTGKPWCPEHQYQVRY